MRRKRVEELLIEVILPAFLVALGVLMALAAVWGGALMGWVLADRVEFGRAGGPLWAYLLVNGGVAAVLIVVGTRTLVRHSDDRARQRRRERRHSERTDGTSSS